MVKSWGGRWAGALGGGNRKGGHAADPTGQGAASPAPPGPWPPFAVRQLCQLLGEITDMADQGFRARLLRQMGYELGLPGPFPVPDSAMAVDHIQDLVYRTSTLRDPAAGLDALLDALRFLRPGTAALAWLEAYVQTLTEPDGLLAPERMLPLLDVLRTLRPVPHQVTVQRLLHACQDPEEVAPVRGQDGLPEIVVRLNLARQRPGTTPLLLRFLDALTRQVDAPEGHGLGELLKEALHDLGLTEEDLPGDRARSSSRRPPEGSPLVLQIVLEEVSAVGAETERAYGFEASLFETTEQPWGLVAKFASPTPLPLSRLRQSGSGQLTGWQALSSAAGAAEDLRVEFLLPWSLLDHPADLWPLDEDGYPVGMYFPVVVRSLDRLRSTLWHRAWRTKWRALEEATRTARADSVADHLGWLCLEDGAAPLAAEAAGRTVRVGAREGDVRRWLDSRPDIACLALSFPYVFEPGRRQSTHTAVKDAVREGIPVIAWRRDGGSSAGLNDLMSELAVSQLHGLAGHVHRCRRAAAADDPDDIGNQLTLLWDQPGPNDFAEPSPLAAPGYRGGHATSEQEGQSL